MKNKLYKYNEEYYYKEELVALCLRDVKSKEKKYRGIYSSFDGMVSGKDKNKKLKTLEQGENVIKANEFFEKQEETLKKLVRKENIAGIGRYVEKMDKKFCKFYDEVTSKLFDALKQNHEGKLEHDYIFEMFIAQRLANHYAILSNFLQKYYEKNFEGENEL